MKIKAVFIGKQNANYSQGCSYVLDFYFGSARFKNKHIEKIEVQKVSDTSGKTTIQYNSLKKFLQNWAVK